MPWLHRVQYNGADFPPWPQNGNIAVAALVVYQLTHKTEKEVFQRFKNKHFIEKEKYFENSI